MSAPTQALDIRQFLNKILIEVFETMLSLQPETLSPESAPAFKARVTGSVGFGGETVTGAVYLHLPEAFALRCSSRMLGVTPTAINRDADVNDLVGELANMVAGGLRSGLCDTGNPCVVSTPAVLRGGSQEIEALPGMRREMLYFRCDNEPVAIELHIKFN